MASKIPRLGVKKNPYDLGVLNVIFCMIHLKYFEISQFNFCCYLSVTFGHYNTVDEQSWED